MRKITNKALIEEFGVSERVADVLTEIYEKKVTENRYIQLIEELFKEGEIPDEIRHRIISRFVESDDWLSAANELIQDCYGTEAILEEGKGDDWRDVPLIEYVNRGDTYRATIIFLSEDVGKHHYGYYISSWGDVVEMLEAKGRKFK